MDMLAVLKERFELHPHRHPNTQWETLEAWVQAHHDTIVAMEETGGEPDFFEMKDGLFFVDASVETPAKRRNTCYDKAARVKRKKFPPETSAMEMCFEMGVKLLDEERYHELQGIDVFDVKTSSWIETPEAIRALGGSLFGDRRYNRSFTYHNGADSYYGSRGFRSFLKVK